MLAQSQRPTVVCAQLLLRAFACVRACAYLCTYLCACMCAQLSAVSAGGNSSRLQGNVCAVSLPTHSTCRSHTLCHIARRIPRTTKPCCCISERACSAASSICCRKRTCAQQRPEPRNQSCSHKWERKRPPKQHRQRQPQKQPHCGGCSCCNGGQLGIVQHLGTRRYAINARDVRPHLAKQSVAQHALSQQHGTSTRLWCGITLLWSGITRAVS